ncbi:hypothetical protein CAEBREN_24084 [Caenorhabditis brenneri]|uniref:Smr domain-containing protein n=1 Tax=Caenorhabditis brenneri TaxID=135651 RepID=G0MCL0_CAEBE|nr:hypothetical protein CAEBREN_24084 [Caenorhabditis brenneri]
MQAIKYNAYGEEYHKAHRLMKIQIDRLYAEREDAETPAEKSKIENEINEEVAAFNLAWPKAKTYIDLHWATVQGALDLVARRVKGTRTKWLLEPGIGHGSKNNVPAIKRALLKKYHGKIQVDEFNKGLLILKMR